LVVYFVILKRCLNYIKRN